MKKWFIYLTLVCVGVLSCINTHDMPEEDIKIVFDAIIDNNTKVMGADVKQYPENVPFKVWAYSNDNLMIEGNEAVFTDGVWMTYLEYVWPTSAVDFYAFSPSSAEAEVSRDNGVVYKGFDISKDCDFLCALPVRESLKPDIDVPVHLIFETPLCEVEFQAYTSSEDRVTTWITDVELFNVAHVADYAQLPGETWTGYDDFKNIEIYEGRQELTNISQKVGDTLLIIPQQLTLVVHYSYMLAGGDAVIQRVEEVDMKDAPIAGPGRKRVYTIKVTEDVVTIQKPKTLQ